MIAVFVDMDGYRRIAAIVKTNNVTEAISTVVSFYPYLAGKVSASKIEFFSVAGPRWSSFL